MKDLIQFLLFLIYSTSIFFLPNNQIVFFFIFINVIGMLLVRKKIKKALKGTLKMIPFILFTLLINCLLDNIMNAIWIGIKLLIVCNMTMIYSSTTTTNGVAETIKTLCFPLKLFKVNTDEIKMIVCISLSMIPILRKDLMELKEACRAKGMILTMKNTKFILSKFCLSMLIRVNQLDEALIAKGQSY